jgi:hypothetical protein
VFDPEGILRYKVVRDLMRVTSRDRKAFVCSGPSFVAHHLSLLVIRREVSYAEDRD